MVTFSASLHDYINAFDAVFLIDFFGFTIKRKTTMLSKVSF